MILLLALSFCTRKRESAPEDSPAKTSTGQRNTQIKPKREITLTKEESKDQTSTEIHKTGETHFMLPLPQEKRTLPEDFKIGALEDILAGSKDRQELISVVHRFFNSLAQGRIDSDSILRADRERICRSLAYYVERNIVPETYRLGRIAMPEEAGNSADRIDGDYSPQDEARLNIRLFGKDGVSEGELYLAKADGRWYIADIQISFELLNRAYVRQEEEFVPSLYGWRNP